MIMFVAAIARVITFLTAAIGLFSLAIWILPGVQVDAALYCCISLSAALHLLPDKELEGRWEDLPVASFAESGTNIPTGYLIVRAED